jgi:F-type H+-transporting ATPase subunit b
MMFYISSAQDVLDKGQSIAQEFGVDWPMLIAQAVNFVLVAFVIYRFGFKGILSTIQEREKQISDSLKHAEKIKLELEETERKQKETLQEASLEAKKTVTGAQEQAKSYIEGQKEDARKQAEEIIAKAKESTVLERERVLNEAKDEISSLVVLTTGKVLQKELNDEEKSRFSNAAAQELKISD